MAKTKWVDGWLCRDGYGDFVFFIPEPSLVDGDFGQEWQSNEEVWEDNDWEATYDLAPPAKGKKFYVSIEL